MGLLDLEILSEDPRDVRHENVKSAIGQSRALLAKSDINHARLRA